MTSLIFMPLSRICLLLLMILPLAGFGGPAVSFSKLPASLQLYPRNLNTNTATVPVVGKITTQGYTVVTLLVRRNGSLWKYSRFNLYYRSGAASFYFYPVIAAELAEYRFDLYAGTGSDSSFITSRDSITCGDVYLINGQSNSHASKSIETYQNEYCRTFGIQTGNSNYDAYNPGDTSWHLARGFYPNLTGVWGLHLQRLIVENLQVPVCIINGGTGGSIIEEHMKNATAPDFYTNSIYGKLLYRVQKAGVAEHIRAIFWDQGESNATNDFPYYEDLFNRLYSDWKNDYPSVEKIYLFQINIGCTISENAGQFREGQRSLKYVFPDVETFATIGLPGHDGCHYDSSGHHAWAREIFRLVARDFYNGKDTTDIASPDISRAYYTSTARREIILEFNNVQNLVWPEDTLGRSLEDFFYPDGMTGKILSGTASGRSVRLKLSAPSTATTLTYLPTTPPDTGGFRGPCLRNARGVPAFSFFKFPIDPPALIGPEKGCPGAFGPVKHIYGTLKSDTSYTIQGSMTWYSDTLYILHKFVRVGEGATLTIQPGTIIMCAPAPEDTTVLIIGKAARLIATGTAGMPIVFTSCNLQGMRRYGDWGGVVLCGTAPNGQGTDIELEGNYGAQHGGNNLEDNSGTLQYVRIEYGGMSIAPDRAMSSLTFASVGSRTKVSYVQASYSGGDSYRWSGGTVNTKFLVSWKPAGEDFDIGNGYSGYNQFGLGYRDPEVALLTGSNGIQAGAGDTVLINGLKTSAVFSNYELWGPVRSAETMFNNFFRAAVHLQNDTELKIYNSLFVGWPADSLQEQASGIFIDGAAATSNAVRDSIRIRNCVTAAYLPLRRVLSNMQASSWAPYLSATSWYNKSAYKNSIKGNVLMDQKKAPYNYSNPLFTLTSSSVPIASGSSFQTGGTHPLPQGIFPSGFQPVLYRGAFGGTNWMADWTEFHPQAVVYTAGIPARLAARDTAAHYFDIIAAADTLQHGLEIYPNPASGKYVSVAFDAPSGGRTRIFVSDVSGKAARELSLLCHPGKNSCTIALSGISEGFYIIHVHTPEKVYKGTCIINGN